MISPLNSGAALGIALRVGRGCPRPLVFGGRFALSGFFALQFTDALYQHFLAGQNAVEFIVDILDHDLRF